MSIQNDTTINSELRNLGYQEIAAFDEEATHGEALAYFENSQIQDAVVFRNKLSGRVGNFFETFHVRLAIHGNEIACSCTCDSERKICMHAISLLYAWVNDGDDFINLAHVIKKLETFDKAHLLDIVSNILEQQPHMAQLFLQKKKIDWDEIDSDPLENFS